MKQNIFESIKPLYIKCIDASEMLKFTTLCIVVNFTLNKDNEEPLYLKTNNNIWPRFGPLTEIIYKNSSNRQDTSTPI